MGEKDAEKLWNYIVEEYAWNNISEEEPDEIDKEMFADIATNPDCKEFVSEEQALKEIGIIK